MEQKDLQKHIRALALLEETGSPVISYYLNWERGDLQHRLKLTEQSHILRRLYSGQAGHDFEAAMNGIEVYVDSGLLPDTKGVAIFARAGTAPFFLPLQFQVPLPNWIAANSTPNIYHLIELKDTYHRYVLMISTEESARILEVSLGAVTEELWRERPDLRKRVGREWTKEHYQNHRRERTNQFVREKIKILERLMRAGGHTHLILAGSPHLVTRVRRALPLHLEDKLIDTIVTSSSDDVSDVVAATLSQFIEQEQRESLALVEVLVQELQMGGLAVAGAKASLRALAWGQADVLIVAKDLSDALVREELVRLAEQTQCHIEIVEDSPILMEFGGVGCLLRYAVPDDVGETHAVSGI
jgi:protein required for attachment to host cells/ribosomal protein L7Ae-like RNA K-turn-binding protein